MGGRGGLNFSFDLSTIVGAGALTASVKEGVTGNILGSFSLHSHKLHKNTLELEGTVLMFSPRLTGTTFLVEQQTIRLGCRNSKSFMGLSLHFHSHIVQTVEGV